MSVNTIFSISIVSDEVARAFPCVACPATLSCVEAEGLVYLERRKSYEEL
jgi:hypothetical protein